MRNFAIVEPFKLDWKYAAPHDYEILEYFVTPKVSILFHNITNGKNPFHVGSYIMEDASKRTQFNNEVLPQRSKERVERAFKDEAVSVFFTLEDAKALDVLFTEEGFICRRVEVLYDGRPVNILELPEGDFEKVARLFGELKVLSTMDWEKQHENITEQVDEMREEIARGLRKQFAERDAKMVGMTKKAMWVRGSISAGLLATSAALAGASKMLIDKKTKVGIITGSLTAVASIAVGIAGRQMASGIIEHVQKGLVLNYG